jgi:hypothetical protein
MASLRVALSLSLALALGACATTGQPSAEIPAAARPGWERCRPVLVEWCHGVAHGDPPQERACLDDATRQYLVAGTETARRQFLLAHGCRP